MHAVAGLLAMEGRVDMGKLAMLVGFAFLALSAAIILIVTSDLAQANDDHGDFRSVATPMVIGSDPITGDIDPTQILFDVDYFSFFAKRGVRYTFVLDLVTVQDANMTVVNSVARGTGSSPGQVITVDGNRLTIQWIARTSDTYYVEVSGVREGLDGPALLGFYSLSSSSDASLEDRHSEERNGASPIVTDNVYQGAISPWTNQPGLAGSRHGGDDTDYFSFQAARGVHYTVSVEPGTIEGIAILVVNSLGGIELSNGATGTRLTWIAPATATYFIALAGSSQFKDSVGTYNLKLSSDTSSQDRHSQNQFGATPLSFGNAIQGAVSPESDRDVFSFQASRGVKYSFGVELGTAQGIHVAVEGPDGDTLASNDGVGTGLEWLALADGTYFVVVSGSSQVRDSVGTYLLIVSAEAPLADRHGEVRSDATPISFGNQHQGAISPANDLDYFSFPATRGTAYTIDVALGTAEGVRITVAKPAGGTDVSTGGVGTKLEWTAKESGTYFIVISAPPQVNDPVGTYALTVGANSALEDRYGDSRASAASISVGTTYQAAISPEGDADYFSFRARRGVRYVFELNYDTAAAAFLTVDKAGGEPGASASNYGEGTDVVWIAPVDDQYFVAVSGSPKIEDPTGTYALRISADTYLEDRHSGVASKATQIISGNALAGALSPAGDFDYFYFDAEQGESYTVRVDLGTIEAVRFSVSHALAGFTTSNFGEGTSLQWQAPVTGRYILVVSSATQASNPIGTYQVTVISQSGASPDIPRPNLGPTPVGPRLEVSSRTASPGTIVQVPIILEQAQDLSGLGFSLRYDPSVIEVVNVLKGSSLSPAAFSYDADVPGLVRVGFASTIGFNGSGTAAVVEFRVLGAEGGASALSLSEELASDSAGEPLSLRLVNGNLSVAQPIAGDGNGDGKITALDALIALRMFARITPVAAFMDVDGDGRVTQGDAQQILAMASPG